MVHRLKMEVDIPDNLLSEILVTAFEGEDGGSRFWAEPVEDVEDDGVKYEYPDLYGQARWLEIRIRQVEQADNDFTYWTVSRGTIRDGMQRLLDENFSGHEAMQKLQHRIREAVIEDDASMIDTDDADTMVQFGLFGDQRYG